MPQVSEAEEYACWRLYLVDFDTTLHTLRTLKQYRRLDVRIPLVRDATVSYARPFSKNFVREKVRHVLSSEHVPAWGSKLHAELLNLRFRQFAHTDALFYEPTFARFTLSPGTIFPMSFRGYDYADLLTRTPEIEQLVEAVSASVRQAASSFEERVS